MDPVNLFILIVVALGLVNIIIQKTFSSNNPIVKVEV